MKADGGNEKKLTKSDIFKIHGYLTVYMEICSSKRSIHISNIIRMMMLLIKREKEI